MGGGGGVAMSGARKASRIGAYLPRTSTHTQNLNPKPQKRICKAKRSLVIASAGLSLELFTTEGLGFWGLGFGV